MSRSSKSSPRRSDISPQPDWPTTRDDGVGLVFGERLKPEGDFGFLNTLSKEDQAKASGGGRGTGSLGLAAAGAGSGFQIDLSDHENINGSHTIAEHVGKSSTFMKGRMTPIRVGKWIMLKPAHSSFTSLRSANALASATLANPANAAKIARCLASDDTRRLTLTQDFRRPTPNGYYRDSGIRAQLQNRLTGNIPRLEYRTFTGVSVTLSKNAAFPYGFNVHTGYPAGPSYESRR